MRTADTLGQPALGVPEIAYRRPDAYHSGSDLAPRKDATPYQEYKLLGRLPLDERDKPDVRAEARAKYGRNADVFRTARCWVVYVVR